MILLPDGTVQISNKTTGQIKVVKPEELPNYGIPYSKYASEKDAAIKSGAIKESRPVVSEKVKDVSSSIKILEKNYNQLEAKGPASGRTAQLMSTLTGGKLNPEVGDYEALRKSLIGPLARAISGEVGVLTDKDIARAEGLLPKVSDDPKLAARKLNNLKEIVKSKGGEDLQLTEIPKDKNLLQSNTIPFVTSLLGGGLGGIAGPGGAIGGAAAGYAGGDVVRKELAKLLNVQGAEPVNPLASVGETVKGAGEMAALETLGIGAGKVIGKGAELFKPKPPLFTPEILKSGLKAAEEGGALRNTAIKSATEEGKKVEGNKLIKSITDWAVRAKRANPTQKATIDTFVEGAGKSFKGKQITAKTGFNLWQDANTGFSSAGKAGNALESEYHRAVRDTLRKELDKIAPGFEKGTGMIREGLGKEKLLKTIRTGLERKSIKEGLQETPSVASRAVKKLTGPALGAVGYGLIRKILGG